MIRDEGQVPVGVSPAPTVMDVSDRKAPAGFAGELDGAVKKGQGVGASGDGQEDTRVRRHESLPGGAAQGIPEEVHPMMVAPDRPRRRRTLSGSRAGDRQRRLRRGAGPPRPTARASSSAWRATSSQTIEQILSSVGSAIE